MTEGPLLWFLNRASGIGLLVLLSMSVALGVLALRGRAGGDGGARVPRFVTQALHRNLALASVALLIAHAVTAVIDEYVDIRWWQAIVPWGSAYEPWWLGIGTLSLDLMIVIAVTSMMRTRLPVRAWRAIHLTSWAAWLLGVVHGVMIGTDLRNPDGWVSWSVLPTAASILMVLAAAAYRMWLTRSPAPSTSANAELPPRIGAVR